MIVVVAAWLLLRRGLFPGGSGDYYTHYFYYYLEVLKNHGLAPNDVWYHYYYSKGSGLAFLGMLLTDPEAPALTTFPCVIFAAVAIATLAARMAPGSLWPAAGAGIYLLVLSASVSAPHGGGEFQKDHEEVAALVVLTAWALCMERRARRGRFAVMAAATAIAAAIATQAVGVLLGFFVGLLAAWSMLRAALARDVGLWRRRCRDRQRRACGVRVELCANRLGERSGARSDAALRRFRPARSLGRYSADHCGGVDQGQLPAMVSSPSAGNTARDRQFHAASLSLAVPDRTAHRGIIVLRMSGALTEAADGRATPDRPHLSRATAGVSLPWCCCSRSLRLVPGARKVSPLPGSARFLFPCW